MVKYAITASVAIIQLAIFARTSFALPIEYPEELESRAIYSSDGQQFAERELEARNVGIFENGSGSAENRRRDVYDDLDARDWKEFVKRYINDALDRRAGESGQDPQDPQAGQGNQGKPGVLDKIQHGVQSAQNVQTNIHNAHAAVVGAVHQVGTVVKHPTAAPASGSGSSMTGGGGGVGVGDQGTMQNRRDLSELDWDEYEKRSFNEFEERDWNEFEERDWDDDYELEARGLDFDERDFVANCNPSLPAAYLVH